MIANWHSARHRLAHGEHGTAAVEFAVTASVLFLMLIGIMKICLAVYTYHFISEAAREGSRYAMVRGATCVTGSGSSCTVTAAQIQTYVQNLGYPGITGSSMTVTTTWSSYPSGTCTPSSSCNNPGNLAKVKVSYALPLSIPFTTTKNYTLTSASAMVISQ